MTSQHPDFDEFYDDQVAAHRQLFPQQNPWDRITQPSVLISCLIVVVTITYNLYASTTTFQESIRLLGTSLWDGLVVIVPQSLLNALDTPDNSTTTTTSESMRLVERSHHAVKSDKMRRVLGLTRPGGVMSSVFEVRNRALSMTGSVLGLKTESDRPPGLGNMDNSCYQNSILQGLSSLKPLPEYLSTYLEASNKSGDQDVAQTLRALIADLNDVSNYGRTLWTPSLLKSMSTWTQQDAQEYYSKLLDDIDKSVAKAIKNAQPQHPGLAVKIDKDDAAASEHSDDSGYQSIISSPELKSSHNPLEGMLAQRVACVRCGYSEGLSMIPFTCLTLSLGLNKNQHDLYERLDAYSKVEVIENVECAKCTLLKHEDLLSKLIDRMRNDEKPDEHLQKALCRLEAVKLALEEDDFEEKTLTEKCSIPANNKVSSTKTKQIVISRAPKSLAVHMQRSVFDPSTFNMMKNSAPVNFPMTLDLGPWCLGSASNSSTQAWSAEEKWDGDPRESMIAGDQGSSKFTGPIYELRAVVTHYGRHENGHYICYRKYPRHSPPTKAVDDEEPDSMIDIQPELERKNHENDLDEPEMDWWRLSDHNVSKVSEDVVLTLSPGVFMLFYDCVDSTMVMNDQDERMQDANEVADLVAATGLASATDNTAQIAQGHETQKSNGKPKEASNLGEDATPYVANDQAAIETTTRGSNLITNTASLVHVTP
ncbi:related to ubiquitin-specific proteinase UBP1 [Fusarium fujikuroi IMI 58289]|uniref:ubiquitinyl hydrolase 1 n=1 Tax=Gibberella fujikuroi (strain CBS 195.34 / IMI 58289 / NRRL A-6831) TaxID=1279085 RepID=S0E0F3_GIBF5|nr:related to ubiquitin-specific proteinase UBP1 [Fusarium fujikuroi IMI 58289]KLO91219.1 ubiquitin-specific proteinase UBP1 [Fusarium fujikuroi]KLO97689.1 ubiquitin-specific proteinase UBP1 [Fusarium fujikuroi]CCT67117.1 related to ubiquitin-specific proteinase UBP1 [Fusarium fujikuroi IMI 58289]SCN96059.1 related to ubiquitin-specific proteinase UBP1 [Fusarium fujikuroi]SCO40966.1 related to ubiquitin-specific proteinase UBP1 [Fusarium fujikuroi]